MDALDRVKVRKVYKYFSARDMNSLVDLLAAKISWTLNADGHLKGHQATVHWLRHTGISDDINKNGRSVAGLSF